MKLKLFSLLALLLFINVNILGQVTITSKDVINAGDTIIVSLTNNPSIDINTTGPGSIWDFSELIETEITEESASSISSAGFLVGLQFGSMAPEKYKASYVKEYDGLPLDLLGNFLPVQIDAVNRVSKVEDDKLSHIGYTVKASGQEIGFRSDTIEVVHNFPFTYGDEHTSKGYTYINFNPILDVKIIQRIKRETNADGYGTLITPYNTYEDIVRVHHTITERDSIYINFSENGFWIPFTRNIHEYEWWGKGYKVPLLKVETEGILGSGAPTRISYYKDPEGILGEGKEAMLYPNPASDHIYLQFLEEIEEVSIFTMDGQCVFTRQVEEQKIKIDVSEFASGVYLVKAKTYTQEISTKFVIK